MEYENIIKYLQGQATAEEKNQLFVWIEQSPKNKVEFISIKKAWALTNRAQENTAQAWKLNILPNIQLNNKRRLLYAMLQKAAILILVFGLGGLTHYFLNSNLLNTEAVYDNDFFVEVPFGQTSNIKLPDGSSVVLNSGSSIAYNNEFSKGKREVRITGEAFFDVAKDKKHPFLVKSSILDIQVYGTSFNVQVYPDENSFSTTLVEGSISVLDKKGTELSLLKPGENASMDEKHSSLKISKVDTEMFTSWKEGVVTFRNEKLGDIAKKMERWYNVEIEIQNTALENEAYFFTILRNKPIDQVLEALEVTSELHYEIIPRAAKPTLIYWK